MAPKGVDRAMGIAKHEGQVVVPSPTYDETVPSIPKPVGVTEEENFAGEATVMDDLPIPAAEPCTNNDNIHVDSPLLKADEVFREQSGHINDHCGIDFKVRPHDYSNDFLACMYDHPDGPFVFDNNDFPYPYLDVHPCKPDYGEMPCEDWLGEIPSLPSTLE